MLNEKRIAFFSLLLLWTLLMFNSSVHASSFNPRYSNDVSYLKQSMECKCSPIHNIILAPYRFAGYGITFDNSVMQHGLDSTHSSITHNPSSQVFPTRAVAYNYHNDCFGLVRVGVNGKR